ncbi:MAG: hypothetical protein K2X03_02080 [Bryobacteraceae bacterium]|nr:hypothetical protein [Bryobacteraceae bacterium]
MIRMLNVFTLGALAALIGNAQVPPTTAMPPMSADIEVERITTLRDGNVLKHRTTGHFYRDEQRRTRLELGDHVTIFDPVGRKMIALNLTKRTARVTNLQNKPEDRRSSESVDNESGAAVDLGTRDIAGYPATGKEHRTVIPAGSALGNAQPITRVSRQWFSAQLTLPLLTTVDDPLAGNTTTSYQNLAVNKTPDPGLFKAPDGFSVTQVSWIDRQAPQKSTNPLVPQSLFPQ